VNPGDGNAQATFHLVDDAGDPIVAPVIRTIPPHGQLRIAGHELFGLPDPATATQLVAGSVIVESDTGLVGNVTFGDPVNAGYLASMPLLKPASARRAIFLDHVAIGNQAGVDYFTGLAFVNPSLYRTANVSIELFAEDGTLVTQTTTPYVLEPGQRVSMMLPDFLDAFAGSQFGGFLRVSADVDIFAYLLFGDEPLNFLSAVPAR
jgi:hypothetical protein